MSASPRMPDDLRDEFKRRIADELSPNLLSSINPYEVYSPSYNAPLTEPILELLRPCEAWTVRNPQGWDVMVTPNSLPVVDIDFKDHPQLQDIADDPVSLLELLRAKQDELRVAPSLRVYRTRGGIRLLVESAKWYPRSDEFTALAKTFGCDKQYLTLSQRRNSYRLRLTPKVIGIPGKRRVCSFVGSSHGNHSLPRDADWLIGIHDERTGAFRTGGELLG